MASNLNMLFYAGRPKVYAKYEKSSVGSKYLSSTEFTLKELLQLHSKQSALNTASL